MGVPKAVLAGFLGVWSILGIAREPLRVSVSEAWGPPFLLATTGADAPRRGLIPDWYAVLESELGHPLLVHHAPPSRTKRRARSGEVDLRCFHDPAWEADEPVGLFVDVPQIGLAIEERIVGLAEAPMVSRLDQLTGKRVGTVLGYAYPALEVAFASGDIRREDAPAEMNVLEKQREGRTDYAVARLSTLAWLQQGDPRWRTLRASPWSVSSTPLYCGVRAGGPLDPKRLVAAQQRMVESGELAALLERYGLD